MTDIIIRQQQIQVKVRFSVGLVGILRFAVTFIFIGIQKYGMYSVLFLFFQGTGHFVKSVPGENIVMVKKADIGSLCQFYRRIGISGNSIIRGQPDVADSLISPGFGRFSDTVSRARIRQDKFPAGVGLFLKGIQKLLQVNRICFISRHRNAEEHRIRPAASALGIQFCLSGRLVPAARTIDSGLLRLGTLL